MKFSYMFLALFMTVCAHAEVFKLAEITSEFDKDVMDFYVETNDHKEIDSIRYITTRPDGSIFEDVSVPAETIIAEGVVIVERDEYAAVRLEVEEFTVKSGGIVKLNYLYSGITGTRHVKRLHLRWMDEQLGLLRMENVPVNRMYLKANHSRIFGIIGIREILTSFAFQKVLFF